jgi:trehalose synthase
MPMRIEDYSPMAGRAAVDELKSLGEDLKGEKVLHINSTYIGGGVAELLKTIVPMMSALGLKADWKVIKGDAEFFEITKKIHNALHGAEVELNPDMLEKYIEINEQNARELDLVKDFIFIHDPQPAPLINFREKYGKWIWRCHIDISAPNLGTWLFLSKIINKYNAVVIHIPEYAKSDLLVQQHVIPPSIDPLSEKNIDLPESYIEKILRKYDIDPEMPIVTQVSRFDRLKDPAGVFKAFEIAKSNISTFDFGHLLDKRAFAFDVFRSARYRTFLQLILVGGTATDDPEGERVYYEVLKKSIDDRNVHVLMLPPDAHKEINAIQRGSTLLIQKSIKEGFGLTVTEGMWKGKPIIGGRTGGIRHQIIDGETGFLVSSPSEAAERILFLLKNADVRERLGMRAKEHVRMNYLVTRQVRDYLKLLKMLKT